MEVANKILLTAGANNSNKKYAWLDALVMILLTALSVYNGQASVFYIIYLFWWNEVIIMVISWIFNKIYNREKVGAKGVENFGRLVLLGIYWVFIILFFCFIANWGNNEIMTVNFQVLLFKNIYFNANLVFFILAQLIYNLQLKNVKQQLTVFTPNMLVLHISIILGGLMLFFIVKRFPETFTPENLWGSVLIILPFLLLRFLISLMIANNREKTL